MSMNLRGLRFIPMLCIGLLLCATLGLLWAVQRAPLKPLPLVILDAPAAFGTLVVLLGALLIVVKPNNIRALIIMLALALVPLTAMPLLAALLLCIATIAAIWPHIDQRNGLVYLLAGGAALGAGLILATKGVWRYDDLAAGAALNIFVFGLTLIAALLPLIALDNTDQPRTTPFIWLIGAFWQFPLLRLFTLGPWNTSWSLATALIGGGIALWAGVVTLVDRSAARRAIAAQIVLPAMALAALGLASSAGVAAWCFAMIVLAVQSQGGPVCPPVRDALAIMGGRSAAGESGHTNPPVRDALAIMALAAPAIAMWMAIGAAGAARSLLLAGMLWLAGLLWGIAMLLGRDATERVLAASRVRITDIWHPMFVLAVGIFASQIATYAIQPVVEQLQGGLTAYGSLSIARWIGLGMNDAGNRVITTAPIIAIAGLAVVLAAVLLLVVRMWPAQEDAATEISTPLPYTEILRQLAQEVPWLPQEHTDANR